MKRFIREWAHEYQKGYFRRGRPLTSTTSDNVERVHELIHSNKRITVDETLPCDFRVSPSPPHPPVMKKNLVKRRYHSDEGVQNATREWLSNIRRKFFEEEIQKLVPRYDKYKNKHSDYLEK